jgi:hypothetical protein
MTVNGTTRSRFCDASRRSSGFVPFAYYYGYFTARREMV